MKTKFGIITILVTVCGIVGIYVANTENPQDTIIAKPIASQKTNSVPDDKMHLGTTEPETSVREKDAQTKPAANAQAHAELARPLLSDVRTLNIVDKLNSFDGGENENLRLALALNADYDFQAIQTKQDRKGNQHTRYRQTYRDIPVWGERVLVHKGSLGDYYSVNGKIASGLEFGELDVQLANIDLSEDALNAVVRLAKKMNQHLSANWTTRNAKSELVIYVDDEDQILPAYAVSYLAVPHTALAQTDPGAHSAQQGATPPLQNLSAAQQAAMRRLKAGDQAPQSLPVRPHMLIDARTNKVIKQWDGLNTAKAHGPGGNEKTGRYEFGTDYPALEVRQLGDTCTLNNHRVKTVDLNHQLNLHQKAHAFTCPDNQHKEINGAYSPLNDAHFFGGLVFDMYKEWFYLAPLNFQLTMAVHYGKQVTNAFWTGTEVVFGDGDYFNYPTVDVNLAAHEISHGFTEQHAGLINLDQSGGINEAFSNIAGEAAEFFWKGEVDWYVGSDSAIGPSYLSFADPSAPFYIYIDHTDNYYSGMDPHITAGIYNLAFYLLANTPNWDIRKAFEVFVLANQFYWEPNATFDSAACGVLDAANDLGLEVRDVDQAFQTVGVNCGLVPFTDSDSDGMDNRWEMRFGLNSRNPGDADTDADGDGVANAAEYHERTNPQNADSDGDGIDDFTELYIYRTNPNLADSDYDGIDDYEERETWLTDPKQADTDRDGMPDGWEIKFGLAPRNASDAGNDKDFDGVSNLHEFSNQADPTLADTDGDGLDDYAEINTHGTYPHMPDSDHDLLSDAEEIARGMHPTIRDYDDDDLSDGKEIQLGSDPFDSDTDNDFLSDGDEVGIWLTSPLESDTDFDGMPDAWEVQYTFNPRVADGDQDADGDGLVNRLEYEFASHPGNADTDNDGLNDYKEVFDSKTDPNKPDSDDDTLPDGWEFQMGLDPLNIEDATLDSDGDGWLNTQEHALKTHPLAATDDLQGVPAKPRASNGAMVKAERYMLCIHSVSWHDVCRYEGARGIHYGWDASLQQEVAVALNFNSLLPWTITSAALGFSARTSAYAQDLTAIISRVDANFPDSNSTLFGQDASAFWDKIKYGPQLSTLTIPASPDNPLFYEAGIDLPFENAITFPLVIGKSINNFQGSQNMDELVFDLVSSPHLLVSSPRLKVTFAPDTDEDGIQDDWEILHGLDPENPADALLDRDQDGATNLQEYLFRLDLDQSDSDNDGMPDGWEIRYGLNPTIDDRQLDRDNDGLINLDEFTFNTHPLRGDTDFDGMPDIWEVRYASLNPTVADANQDTDLDGLSNLQEYEFDLNPNSADTDNDKLTDSEEIFATKTDPKNPDSDDDSLMDGWELAVGLDPLDIEDATLDSDGDGWLNTQEFALGTHPLSATEERGGLPAKPRVPDEATIAPEKMMTCSSDGFWEAECWVGIEGEYGWDAKIQREVKVALTFNSALPWTVASVAFGFSATGSTTGGGLTAVMTRSFVDIPDAGTEIFDWAASDYWYDIESWFSRRLASFLIQGGEAASLAAYESEFDLDRRYLTDRPISIVKSIDNLQMHKNIDELVFDEPLSNHLTVTFKPDTDDDGITDDWEVSNGLDPEDAADAFSDGDQDGAINLQEYLFRLSPNNIDTDFDGMPDGWEIRYGLDPASFSDQYSDRDNDGRTNIDEFRSNTNPLKPDSDGEGID